ncbi:hypothetical protein BCR33DRAFT_713063 [Rhizoclosmatium globosum]|uniref:DUF300-domain-containing protein n=1 Tax=Rhizoclosmatium globosum TaxID=329046 RepID=A0A1Y2CT51_9FUNG|nr:hypothetical protein BCR33DRAFT_713063 [Rhizoclosmatium globosum]|eukprot:ORY50228.1 hypothetical protein BCR33DRAFT_713063 [Rhizoclosmatium globosum]
MAPNSESDDPSEYNAAFNETVDLDFGLTVFFTVLFIFFLALLIRTELKTKLTEAKRKPHNQIFSTFNILLLSMIIANCLNISFEYVYANNNDYNIAALSSSISFLFATIFQSLVILNTWNRGQSVIHATIPRSVPFVKLFLVSFGMLQVFQIVLYVLSALAIIFESLNAYLTKLNLVVNTISIILDVFMGIFDVFVTGVYFYYLYSTNGSGLDVKKLVILSRYGLVSIFCLECWTWFNYTMMNSAWIGEPVPPISVLAFRVSLHTCDLMPLVYLAVQMTMKSALLKCDVETRFEIEKARSVRRETGLQESCDMLPGSSLTCGIDTKSVSPDKLSLSRL